MINPSWGGGTFHRQPRLFFFVFLTALALTTCKAAPPESVIREAITRYFEAKNYRVVELDIGNVESGPLGEKTYMAPEGYLIELRKITLEVTEDIGEPWNYRKGQVFTFTDASVRIRREKNAQEVWIVGTVSGIPVR
ncbi:MAG: hypothetical protein ACM34I_06250 [bacterium]